MVSFISSPKWWGRGTKAQVIFSIAIWLTGYTVSILYFLFLLNDVFVFSQEILFATLVGFGLTYSSVRSYRREKRRILSQPASRPPSYPIFSLSYQKDIFVLFMFLLFFVMGFTIYAEIRLAYGLALSTDLFFISAFAGGAIGGYIGYRITKTKWFLNSRFASLFRSSTEADDDNNYW